MSSPKDCANAGRSGRYEVENFCTSGQMPSMSLDSAGRTSTSGGRTSAPGISETAGPARPLLGNGDVVARAAADRDLLADEIALRFEESRRERLVGPRDRPHTVCRLGDDDPTLV